MNKRKTQIGKKSQSIAIATFTIALMIFSAAMFISAPVTIIETIHTPFIRGHVCVYVNGEIHECDENIVTNAGKNNTRDILTFFNITPEDGRVNGSTVIALSTTATADSNTTTDCAGEVAASGLTRSSGIVNYETIEDPRGPDATIAVGNWSISRQFTATATVVDVQMTCLHNHTTNGAAGDMLFAYDTFSTVTLNSDDTINITWFIALG